MLQELCKLTGSKGGTIVHVEQGMWSILGDEFLQVHAQGLGRLGGYFINEGILAEQIDDQQVLSTLVGEVIGCDLLPGAIGNTSR